jgi:hypothetical protein
VTLFPVVRREERRPSDIPTQTVLTPWIAITTSLNSWIDVAGKHQENCGNTTPPAVWAAEPLGVWYCSLGPESDASAVNPGMFIVFISTAPRVEDIE